MMTHDGDRVYNINVLVWTDLAFIHKLELNLLSS